MLGLFTTRPFQAGAALPLLLLGLVILPGCGDTYPEDLNYPLRSDPIVVKTPEKQPTQLDAPGRLAQWVESIPAQGGKILDPTADVEKHQLTLVNERLSKSHFDLTEDEARDMGLPSRPEKDSAKGLLEGRRDALQKRIGSITDTMKTVGPKLSKILVEYFGTPAKPTVKDAEDPRLDNKTLAEGSRLYRRHCLHCHGLTGDGRGPTGPWVNPHPRDYRQGKFKFTSSEAPAGLRKARREDLLRTLKSGIEGTSMPSFALLDEEKELQPLVSYVIHLSLRGQIEYGVLSEALESPAGKDADVDSDTVGETLESLLKAWDQTEKKPIQVGTAPAYAGKPLNQLSKAEQQELQDSIRRGFEQFTTGTASCRSCHNDFGRANDFKFDEWGTIVRPANLTAGIYRGGRRPLDLYYRIHSGINGAGMTSFRDTLNSGQIWDIVNFLEAMPYKKMLPEDVREQVWGKD
jgi:mono/diheme cytochrome c family protein